MYVMAKNGGVTQQLQVKIGRPVIVTHCIAHRLELTDLDAVKTSSYLNRFNTPSRTSLNFTSTPPINTTKLQAISRMILLITVVYRTQDGWPADTWQYLPWRSISPLSCTCSRKQEPQMSKGSEPKVF